MPGEDAQLLNELLLCEKFGWALADVQAMDMNERADILVMFDARERARQWANRPKKR